jgi:drug/metabolite transporter (DMT)-like permease
VAVTREPEPLPTIAGFAAVAAVTWSLYSNLARYWLGESRSGAVPLFILASALCLLAARLFIPQVDQWPPAVVLWAGIMGLITLVAYALWELGVHRGHARKIWAAAYFLPLASTVVMCLFLGLQPGTYLWLGAVLITVGSLLGYLAVRPARELSDEPASQN